MEIMISMGLLLGAGILGAWRIGGEFDREREAPRVTSGGDEIETHRVSR